jgi:hypothetical protein
MAQPICPKTLFYHTSIDYPYFQYVSTEKWSAVQLYLLPQSQQREKNGKEVGGI